MIDVSVLVDKLNGMGSGQEVREFLVDQGVKGVMQESHNCPISLWIQRESGCYVDTEDVVAVYPVEDGQTVQQYDLEDAPKSFIAAFDSGDFPELVTPSSYVEDDDYRLQDDYDNCDD